MGEFHDAVSTLLEAFTRGIAVLKRKKDRGGSNSRLTHKSTGCADEELSKALRNSRTDVRTAYTKNLAKFGSGFAAGDGEFLFSNLISKITRCLVIWV